MKLKSSIWIWPLRNVVNLSIRNKNILNPQKLGILCKYSITKHYDNVPDSFRVTEKWRTDQRAPRRPTPSYHYCTHLTWSQLMNKSWYDISNKSSCFIPISSFSNLSVPGAHPESFVIFCPHQLVLLWTVTVSETSSALVATTVWRSADQALLRMFLSGAFSWHLPHHYTGVVGFCTEDQKVTRNSSHHIKHGTVNLTHHCWR